MNKQISINDHYTLKIEEQGKIVRLVVFEKSDECVCRKEKVSVLLKFLQQPAAHLFKGRLQLDKYQNTVSVIVKGQIMGTIAVDEIESLLVA